jgi:hypothetical protein
MHRAKTQRNKERGEFKNAWLLKESSLRPWHLCIFARKILLKKQEDDG